MRLAMGNTWAKAVYRVTLSTLSSSIANRLKRFQSNEKSLFSNLFSLETGEVIRVISLGQDVYVVSGVAWITVAGEDIILKSGGKVSLPSNKDSAIISPLGNMPLTLEVSRLII